MMTREEIKLTALNIVGKPLGDGALSPSDWLSEEAADDLCLAIEDAITAALPAQEWQDISTAPLAETDDEHKILVGWWTTEETPQWQVELGWWDGEEWQADGVEIAHCTSLIKHWLPQPVPPVAVIAEERGTK